MIICEYEFAIPDGDNPKYAMSEVDFYGHLPYNIKFPQHRLSLRRNLESGLYEIYRAFTQRRLVSRKGLVVLQDTEIKNAMQEVSEEVIFSGTLEEAVKNARRETVKFWGIDHDTKDEICRHTESPKKWNCERMKRMVDEYEEKKRNKALGV